MSGGPGSSPWGPMQYGKPDDLKLETDPYAMQGAPDLSPMRQAMMQRIAKQGEGSTNQAMASLNKAGVQGADQTRALADIAGNVAQGQAQGEAQLNQQDFGNRMGLMEALNNARTRKYGIDSQNYGNEQSARQGFWGGAMDLGGTLGGAALGGAFGGPVGAAAGAGIGGSLTKKKG